MHTGRPKRHKNPGAEETDPDRTESARGAANAGALRKNADGREDRSLLRDDRGRRQVAPDRQETRGVRGRAVPRLDAILQQGADERYRGRVPEEVQREGPHVEPGRPGEDGDVVPQRRELIVGIVGVT